MCVCVCVCVCVVLGTTLCSAFSSSAGTHHVTCLCVVVCTSCAAGTTQAYWVFGQLTDDLATTARYSGYMKFVNCVCAAASWKLGWCPAISITQQLWLRVCARARV